MNDFPMRLINMRLKFFRTFLGFTQKKLAEAAGMSEVAIRKYELGIRQPKLSQVEKLASGLNISIWALLGIQNEKIDCEKTEDLIGLLSSLLDLNILQVDDNWRDKEGHILPLKLNPLLSQHVFLNDKSALEIRDKKISDALLSFLYIKETYCD